uniref:Uncharacterized protein n=1 Tax=Physcomitrium patens TaxID=3218 RepID=A0A2K1KLT1_PHYPA|nr:hypothetical protein PHYPA_005627 [Physcomitrium patens]
MTLVKQYWKQTVPALRFTTFIACNVASSSMVSSLSKSRLCDLFLPERLSIFSPLLRPLKLMDNLTRNDLSYKQIQE